MLAQTSNVSLSFCLGKVEGFLRAQQSDELPNTFKDQIIKIKLNQKRKAQVLQIKDITTQFKSFSTDVALLGGVNLASSTTLRTLVFYVIRSCH